MPKSFFHQTLIAEIGSVHDGSFGNALKLVELAAASGADIVKFQTHVADAETLPDAPMPPYFRGEPRRDYFRRTGFSQDQWRQIADHCAKTGVRFLSSPFALEAVEILEEAGIGAYKVASGEVTNIPLLERIAATGKPILISSGMSNWAELEQAVSACSSSADIVVMQCATFYPCPPERIGLNVIGEIRDRFHLPVGFSDHTAGAAAAAAAVALGATCVEKHLTFSKRMYGSDAPNAMEPEPFAAMAAGLREVWVAMDHAVDKDDISPYREMKRVFEKSIVTARAISAGQKLTVGDLAYKKPGDGISAARYNEIVGRVTRRDLRPNQKLTMDDLQ
jgi:N-acetylneuraminate synthase